MPGAGTPGRNEDLGGFWPVERQFPRAAQAAESAGRAAVPVRGRQCARQPPDGAWDSATPPGPALPGLGNPGEPRETRPSLTRGFFTVPGLSLKSVTVPFVKSSPEPQ